MIIKKERIGDLEVQLESDGSIWVYDRQTKASHLETFGEHLKAQRFEHTVRRLIRFPPIRTIKGHLR